MNWRSEGETIWKQNLKENICSKLGQSFQEKKPLFSLLTTKPSIQPPSPISTVRLWEASFFLFLFLFAWVCIRDLTDLEEGLVAIQIWSCEWFGFCQIDGGGSLRFLVLEDGVRSSLPQGFSVEIWSELASWSRVEQICEGGWWLSVRRWFSRRNWDMVAWTSGASSKLSVLRAAERRERDHRRRLITATVFGLDLLGSRILGFSVLFSGVRLVPA